MQGGKTPPIDIGHTISRTFGAIGPNFGPFILLAILLAALPALLLNIGVAYAVPWLMSAMGADGYQLSLTLIPLTVALLAMVPSYILMGALTQGSFVFYNGGRVSFGECLATGLKLVLPLVGLGIMTVLGLMLWAIPIVLLGTLVSRILVAASPLVIIPIIILALVPAIMAGVRWAVAAPALVVERIGIFPAFQRSAELTRDNRWRIFWLVVIYGVVSNLIQSAFVFITTALVGSAVDVGVLSWVAEGLTLVYTAINAMIGATGAAAMYYGLRVAKEGVTSSELAKVFE